MAKGIGGTCSSKCSSGYHDIMEAYDKRKWTGLYKILSARLYGICLSSSWRPREKFAMKRRAQKGIKVSV